jgi:hypothetical protein
MWIVDQDDVAEGDRIFDSHGKWMTGHPREGSTALLPYRISKGPQLSNPVGSESHREDDLHPQRDLRDSGRRGRALADRRRVLGRPPGLHGPEREEPRLHAALREVVQALW